jgi:hypothetical protein
MNEIGRHPRLAQTRRLGDVLRGFPRVLQTGRVQRAVVLCSLASGYPQLRCEKKSQRLTPRASARPTIFRTLHWRVPAVKDQPAACRNLRGSHVHRTGAIQDNELVTQTCASEVPDVCDPYIPMARETTEPVSSPKDDEGQLRTGHATRPPLLVRSDEARAGVGLAILIARARRVVTRAPARPSRSHAVGVDCPLEDDRYRDKPGHAGPGALLATEPRRSPRAGLSS